MPASTHLTNKIEYDLRTLMDCFAEMLEEIGESHLAKFLPWRGEAKPLQESQAFGEHDEKIYSICFACLNLVEENAAAQHRRSKEVEEGYASEAGLWGYYLKNLGEQGMDDLDLSHSIGQTVVEPVLTAHPTEAKRVTILHHQRDLSEAFLRLEDDRLTPFERREVRQELRSIFERLWRTGEVHLEKPQLETERDHIMHYLSGVFPHTIRALDARLRYAWQQAGHDPSMLATPHAMPRLNFGTWVGGDRDGHPGVTPEFTQNTLLALRHKALTLLDEALAGLAADLSFSGQRSEATPRLRQWLEGISEDEIGPISRKHAHEPWRQISSVMRRRLPWKDNDNPHAYKRAGDLIADLEVLAESLREIGAARIAANDIGHVIRLAQTFGFHLATLDIRQNSAFHDKAVEQLLQAADLKETNFSEWDEAKRRAFLEEELTSPRPLARSGVSVGPEADAVLGCFRVVTEHIEANGVSGLGALIVSMTRDVSDLLAVYLLGRETGLVHQTTNGLVCRLPVVPLLETLDDLERGPGILREWLMNDITRRSLFDQAGARGETSMTQQVMIGYSDSNKDGGILASQWGLYSGQKEMSAVAGSSGVKIRFFHGRGGTISRGAGPTHRFLAALPPASLNFTMRITEQGETISQKYSSLPNALYNLELLLAGVVGVSLHNREKENISEDQQKAMAFLAAASRKAYRQLLDTDGFMDFFRQATPLDAIETSQIGSRPARRSGKRTVSDLRAIPWVFSWNQSRFYLSGWYGVGSALAALKEQSPEQWENLTASKGTWPFLRYILTNVESSLREAKPEFMVQYAGLVEDKALGDKFLSMIIKEHALSCSLVEEFLGGDFHERRPRLAATLARRSKVLHVLHHQQLHLLKQWRAEQADGKDSAATHHELLMTVNAIASGLRVTG